VEHAERCGKIRNADRFLEDNLAVKGPLRTSSHSLNDNINNEGVCLVDIVNCVVVLVMGNSIL